MVISRFGKTFQSVEIPNNSKIFRRYAKPKFSRHEVSLLSDFKISALSHNMLDSVTF